MQIRDEEALKRQEERRKANSLGETETRLRGSTVSSLQNPHLKFLTFEFQLANTDAITSKESIKRKREVSEKEREQKEARKQAKMADQEALNTQMAELAKEKAAHAEAR